MLLTLAVVWLVTRLSLRATMGLLTGTVLLLGVAHVMAERCMDHATSAHLDSTVSLFVNSVTHLACTPFESADCATAARWLLTPVRWALKPMLYWTMTVVDYAVPRLVA